MKELIPEYQWVLIVFIWMTILSGLALMATIPPSFGSNWPAEGRKVQVLLLLLFALSGYAVKRGEKWVKNELEHPQD